ncbi:CHAT domain-containing protein [Limnoglobus roseus]|uniref:CHAT domain-containing protein n=1 Tax=Limnoglobus roseus TaxID=2598579 RepID=A0A5C1A627_9BACT|nr:CHAT domain-containing protein [Limnoglobus roseus]QEL14581.1 CHAT domain-containing protein [Limnoglobus roseus]
MTFLLPLVLVLWSPAAPGTDDPITAFRQAEEHFAADRPGLAEPLYRQALTATDNFTVRRSYERLMEMYIKSARPDRAIRISEPFRAWLKKVDDTATTAQLDVVCGERYVELALYDQAEAAFAAALDAKQPLPADYLLKAYRGRAEVASWRKLPTLPQRWKDLEENALAVRKVADKSNELSLRIVADRARAEAVNFRGDAKTALAVLEKLPALHDQLGDPLGRRDTQTLRAKILASAGRYAEADPLFREAIAIHRRERPKKHMIPGDIFVEWAASADAAGKRTEAGRVREQAAAEYQAIIAAAAKPTPPGEVLEIESPFAAFVKLQQLTQAARQFRKALDLAREAGERWSGDQIVDGRLSADRGMMEFISASYPLARDLLRKSLKELDAAQPQDLRATLLVLSNLAATEIALGDAAAAERLIARATQLYRTQNLPDDSVRAGCEYLGGGAAMMRGGYAEALTRFRGGLVICDRVGPATDPVRFNVLLHMALIHKEQGDLTATADRLEQAASVLVKFAEPGDLCGGLIAAVRADISLTQGKVAEAVAHVPEIEKACQANGVTGGFMVATARHTTAMNLLVHSDLAGAEKIWQEQAQQQRADKHVLLARSLNYLGMVSEFKGRDDDARKYFNEARTFQASRSRCPLVTQCLTLWRLAVLADKAGQYKEAKALAGEVFDIADKARLNTFGEAAARATFYAQFNHIFELLAHWHARDGEADGVLRVITRSRSRTLLDQILAAGVDPRERITGPGRDKLLANEVTARESISRLRAKAQFLSAEDPQAKQVVADLEKAQKDYAEAWKEIVAADPVTKALTDPTMTATNVTGLPRDPAYRKTAVLAYLVGRDESFAVLSPGPDQPSELFKLSVPQKLADSIGDVPTGQPTYVATRRGITIVPLGKQPDAPPTDAGPTQPLTGTIATRIVDSYLRQVTDEAFNPTRGIVIVERATKAPTQSTRSETLGDVALPPALRARLKAIQPDRVVLIPDGAFHKVPFECLVVSTPAGPKFGLDELPPLIYAPSPAILGAVTAREKPTGPASLLTVGDPAYGEAAAGGDRNVRRDSSAINFRGNLPLLPFSSVESKRVREAFPAELVTSLLGEQATEKAVVAGMADKRFIHIAAHGFADDRFGNLFAAIALTPPKGDVISSGDDGFLSLHEIHRLKLNRCDLTVLSACTTNVGPQRPLEAGVTLAGAFLCAGSRRVMASCWSVDDQATSELMATFFKLVQPGTGGQSYPDAMKAARQKIRNTPGWESPFFWAPFVFAGVPD